MYDIFRNILGCKTEYVLLALLPNGAIGGHVYYETLQFNDSRQIVIIGGNELYYYYHDTIIAWTPIFEPEYSQEPLFEGKIFLDGKCIDVHHDRETLLQTYAYDCNRYIESYGKPIHQTQTDTEALSGHAVWYDENAKIAHTVSYEINVEK